MMRRRSEAPLADGALEPDAVLDALLAQSAIGVTIVDRNLRIVHTNAAFGVFGDRSVAELEGSPLAEALPQLAATIVPDLRVVIASGEASVSQEIRLIDALDPTCVRYFRAFRCPVVSTSGAIVGASSTAIEITDLKNAQVERDVALRQQLESDAAELASRRAEVDALARYRTIFDRAAIGILRVDRTGRVIEANPAIQRMLGYDAAELMAMRFQEYTHVDDVDENLRLFHEIMDGHTDSYVLEKRCFRKDGDLIWVRVTAVAERDAAGQRSHAITMIEDITERRLAEQARLAHAAISEYQALHDALTGLSNRRQLTLDLASATAHATADRPARLVVFDLDGFKAYNDAFGHHGGDLLLTRLGAAFATAVAPHGTSYRLGGDEFCALFPFGAGDRLVRACALALGEAGDGFSVSSSHGSVLLPNEARDPDLAMQLADERMYAEKHSSRASAGQQTRNLALKMLSAHEPDVEHHSTQVAALADGVGRRLGLPAAERAELVRAAELHDIGKIAIPYAVLHKPSALDDGEREMMQRHSTMGANILSAAPALERIAEIVRFSHERFDGTGYPLGIAGPAIPLASRIVFVCDSFDAMVSNRPYSPAMSDEEALEELHRHAGSQFDPEVVTAFCAEHHAESAAVRLHEALESMASHL